MLYGVLSTEEVFIGKDNSKSSSFGERVACLTTYTRGALNDSVRIEELSKN